MNVVDDIPLGRNGLLEENNSDGKRSMVSRFHCVCYKHLRVL
jgi:hypothetical protein